MSALQLHDVSKDFHAKGRIVRALKGINLDVDEGEVFGFVGPNGAGKSTTIKIILDIINSYEGLVTIYGKSSRLAESRNSLSYLPEAPSLYDQFTPLEVLMMAMRMYGIQKKNIESHCMFWLERFSVAQNAKRKIRQLSKGNVQRVALAHTMASNPRLLILDEPLSGLDPVGRMDVINILQEYKNNGGAIFFTSHVLHDVERLADRFGFINEGELITTRDPRELIAQDASKFIVRYQSTDASLTDGLAIREHEYEHEVDQASLASFIERIHQHDSTLISVTPSVTLERTFFEIINEKNPTQSIAK